MKLVAIAVKDELIAQHFGHCDYFKIFEIENKKVLREYQIKNPPHQKGALPNFLYQNNVNVVITGNLGEMAVNNLTNLGIEAIRGVDGNPEDVIAKYLNDNLESSNIICDEHQHHNHWATD